MGGYISLQKKIHTAMNKYNKPQKKLQRKKYNWLVMGQPNKMGKKTQTMKN